MKKKTLPEKWFIRGCEELKAYTDSINVVNLCFDIDLIGYSYVDNAWKYSRCCVLLEKGFVEISLQDYLDSLTEDEEQESPCVDHLNRQEPSDIKHPFQQLTESMFELYKRKNKDYGDSFSKGFSEYGMIMPCIRLEDKFMRFKQLVRSGEQEVKDEKIEDTLIDMANYAIMTLIELKKKKYAE